MPAQRLARQSIPDQSVQPFEPLAHIGDSSGQIDPCGWTQSKHGLHLLQHTHQALECTRIKIRTYLDPAPARQHYRQPQLDSCCASDFLAANSTFTNRPPAEETGLCSLPTSFLQMAIQRAEAQPATLAKLALPHTTAHKFRHQLLNLRSCTSLGR